MQIRTPLVPVLAAGVLAFASACQPAGQDGGMEEGDMQEEAGVDTAAITATFDSLRVAFETAFAEADFETMASFYAPDATASFPGTPVLSGRDAIRSALEQGHVEGARLSIESGDVRIVDADWVYEMGTGTMTFTPEGADEPQQTTSIHLAVFHRTPQGWKIVNEVIGSDTPPSGSGM